MIIPRRDQFYFLNVALTALAKKAIKDDPQWILTVIDNAWDELGEVEKLQLKTNLLSLVRDRTTGDEDRAKAKKFLTRINQGI